MTATLHIRLLDEFSLASGETPLSGSLRLELKNEETAPEQVKETTFTFSFHLHVGTL